MITLLVTLLLVAVVIYAVTLIVDMLKLPEQVKIISYLIIGVIVLLWLLQTFGVYTTGLK